MLAQKNKHFKKKNIDKDDIFVDNNITITFGLGDLLIMSQIYDTHKNNFKFTYNINLYLVNEYRGKEYINFITDIFNLFNVKFNIIHENERTELNDKFFGVHKLLKIYPLKELTLHNYIKENNGLDIDYIILSVNSRIPTNDFEKTIKTHNYDKLINLLNNNKFNLPIILVGHKNTLHNISIDMVTNYSFYDKITIDNDKFIDKTFFIDKFENGLSLENIIIDVNLIKNAVEVFQIGIGGSFCINTLFSKKMSGYINKSYLQSSYYDSYLNLLSNVKLYDEVDEFYKRLLFYVDNK
jgi:hypothetical protein